MISAQKTHLIGIALFMLVMLGNACTIILVRLLSESELSYSPFQLVFLANGIGALCCLPLWRGQKFDIERPQTRMLVLRALLECTAFTASFYAIAHLPLPMHTALLFMSPIFGSVIAIMVLREQGTPITYGCITVGFIGMLIVTRPGNIDASLMLGAGAALLAALCFACCAVVIKILTRTAPPRRIARNMLWMTSAFAAPFAIAHWEAVPPAHYGYFAALGVLAFALQHLVALALSKVPVMAVIPLNFLQLVAVSGLAYMIFHETVSGYTLLGSAIILCATIYNGIHGARHAREMAAKADLQADIKDTDGGDDDGDGNGGSDKPDVSAD
jgi:drug/metabolite transporter (DMT)-like permease